MRVMKRALVRAGGCAVGGVVQFQSEEGPVEAGGSDHDDNGTDRCGCVRGGGSVQGRLHNVAHERSRRRRVVSRRRRGCCGQAEGDVRPGDAAADQPQVVRAEGVQHRLHDGGVQGHHRKHEGPFPVLLFSHGASAYRMASSALDAGVASWGFVVVSADYVERGVVTQLPGQKPLTLDPERDKRLMLASLDLVTKENDRSTSLLHGIVDGTRVAAAGHSAGGTTAFDALNDPRVKVAVGWAPSAPSATPADKPTMIIGATNDIGVTPTVLATDVRIVPGAETTRGDRQCGPQLLYGPVRGDEKRRRPGGVRREEPPRRRGPGQALAERLRENGPHTREVLAGGAALHRRRAPVSARHRRPAGRPR